MATFVQDTFTLTGAETAGEALSAHSGELGATWTLDPNQSGLGTLIVTAAGRVRVGAGTSGAYYLPQYTASGTPPSATYKVQADLVVPLLPSTTFWAFVLGRVQTGGLTDTQYAFGYDSQLGAWRLALENAGTWSTLASSAATLVAGTTYTIALVLNGSSLSGVVDGSVVCGPLTDLTISSAGKAGLMVYVPTAAAYTPADALGPQFANFLADESVYTVTISPASAALAPDAPQQFTASVSGTTNQSVTWSVVEAGGGTITVGGLYTAPSTPGTYHVQAVAAVDGTSSAQATVVLTAPTTPGTPHISITTASGLDTISVSAAVAPGTNPVAGYRLYASATTGAETDTGLVISPSTFPAPFPAQATAAPGAARYYVVRAYDTAAPPALSAASNEVYSRTTGLVPSGTRAQRVFVAPYGAAASGLAASLGYTVYDYQGAVLQPHTTGQTYEVAGGSGIYAALVGLDTSYAGVLVWDAPSGSGPYVEAFDAGAFAQVAGYAAGLDPASMILQSPAHKILTNAAGQVDVDLSQAIPATASGLSLGRAALAAIAEGVGVWKYDPAARTLVEYAEDGTTVLRSFALTIDGAGTITQRA